MLDTGATEMQRARGRARVTLGHDGRVQDLHQQGSAKVMVPRVHSGTPEAVFLNTAGGLTGGDRFALSGSVVDGTRAVFTTQTAERAYASTGGAAEVDVDLTVGAGATLFWLPQETILFERSELHRRTRVTLEPGARVVACETVVFGRAAMGETLSDFRLRDRREIARGGTPIWIEALALDGDALMPKAALAGARAITTLVVVGDGAESTHLTLPPGFEGTGWDGRYVVRGWSDDLWPLKRGLATIIKQLAGDLPRVWQV